MSAAQLELAASILGPVVEDVVFVGGATIHLWLTDAGAPPARATDDVDVICDVQSRGAYYALGERLRERGLSEKLDEPVVCRWHHGSGLTLDAMPTDEGVLGFSNPWYRLGIETAVERTLDSGARIWAVAPPVLMATKLAAWLGRGKGDVMASQDVHDVLVLVNGRPELRDELRLQPEELRRYVESELGQLLRHTYFDYAIHDAVRGYAQLAAARAEIARRSIDQLLDLG